MFHRKGQGSVEFMLMLGGLLVFLSVFIITSWGLLAEVREAQQHVLVMKQADVLTNVILEVSVQGEGARKRVELTFPQGYKGGVIVGQTFLFYMMDNNTMHKTVPVNVSGSLPSGPGTFPVWVTVDKNGVVLS